MRLHLLRSTFAASLVVGWASVACAADAAGSGFYGGIALRDLGEEQRFAIGDPGNAGRFGLALDSPAASQTVVFGGYRWRNDFAVEAVLGTAGSGYRLPGRGGIGLMLPGGVDESARAWNLDVYGTFGFARRFSLYGRLGFAQSESPTLFGPSLAAPADRRQRDGLSYGVGLRYDLNRSFGLKLEYARVATSIAEAGTLSLPEGDQVQFGLQFRF